MSKKKGKKEEKIEVFTVAKLTSSVWFKFYSEQLGFPFDIKFLRN